MAKKVIPGSDAIIVDSDGTVIVKGALRLTPMSHSNGAEGTIFYDSDDDHIYVATE